MCRSRIAREQLHTNLGTQFIIKVSGITYTI